MNPNRTHKAHPGLAFLGVAGGSLGSLGAFMSGLGYWRADNWAWATIAFVSAAVLVAIGVASLMSLYSRRDDPNEESS